MLSHNGYGMGGLTPRHNSQSNQRVPFIFPTLKPTEILQCMNDLQIPFSEDDLKKPNPKRMQVAYEAFVDILMGITSEQFEISEMDIADCVEHPEIHRDSIRLLTFHSFVCQLMREVGVEDFSLRDIFRPEPGHVRRILSAIINFAKFREEQMVIYDKYVNQADDYNKHLSELQEEEQQLQAQINAAKQRLTKDEAQIERVKKTNDGLLQDIKQCITTQETLVSEVNHLRNSYKERNETMLRNESEENELRHRVADLKSKIVQDPERAKAELQEMNDTVVQSRATIVTLEQNLRKLELRIETMDTLEQEITTCVRLQEDCLAEDNKAQESLQRTTLDREQLEQRQLQVRELDMTHQRITRQITLVQDKLARLDKQKSMKMDGLQTKKIQLEEELKAVTHASDVAKDKVNRNKRLTEEMEQRITELVESTEKDLQHMLNDYLRLKEQVEMYQHELAQVLDY
ncbi:kinetochore-associated Ndc80 complex subunit nuf2 [Dispira parvispora]|uniref:Kinetochore-associated Ndc80 complex subunit nuf2 n=1 Tax=Dispira parvispora TaxID=1520584 RepID=A0A9W8E3Q2_9FUNG|nr:kinetochore-associated Ndc80 complex subunit nuf2 [Dispira parvispora]